MDILFRRRQQRNWLRRVFFKLHAKIELDKEEAALIMRYGLSSCVLIEADQPGLLRNSLLLTLGTYVLSGLGTFLYVVNAYRGLDQIGLFGLTILVFGPALIGFFYYHQKRETIYVRDLMHGRYFTCRSVVALARKEAYLQHITAYLRQVIESAKHWNGQQKFEILPLAPEEAKRAILSGPEF